MSEKGKVLNRIMFVLSILGVIMAVYVLQSFLRQSSIFCLSGGGCEAVRRSPVSYPFGIPVPAFGLMGYIGLSIITFLRTLGEKSWHMKAILGIAIFGVCFVSWFTVMELFVIKGTCMWCAISSINMYIIFALTLVSKKNSKNT